MFFSPVFTVVTSSASVLTEGLVNLLWALFCSRMRWSHTVTVETWILCSLCMISSKDQKFLPYGNIWVAKRLLWLGECLNIDINLQTELGLATKKVNVILVIWDFFKRGNTVDWWYSFIYPLFSAPSPLFCIQAYGLDLAQSVNFCRMLAELVLKLWVHCGATGGDRGRQDRRA